jgi:molybdopterin-guanine dinucleotide biosynthesis protein B
VEGYKWEALPKLEVFRPDVGKPPMYPLDPHIVAVASSMARPDGLAAHVAWLDLADRDAVLRWIRHFHRLPA